MQYSVGENVGSISHGDELIGTLAAKKENVISLGLDIEKIGRVKPDMWYLLFTEKEKVFLNSLIWISDYHTLKSPYI